MSTPAARQPTSQPANPEIGKKKLCRYNPRSVSGQKSAMYVCVCVYGRTKSTPPARTTQQHTTPHRCHPARGIRAESIEQRAASAAGATTRITAPAVHTPPHPSAHRPTRPVQPFPCSMWVSILRRRLLVATLVAHLLVGLL